MKKTPCSLFEQAELSVLGLMSGTSADGLDICRVEFSGFGKYPAYRVTYSDFIPYPEDFSAAFKRPLDLSGAGIAHWNMAWGKWVGTIVKALPVSADIIASHGQTLLHRPPDYTLQIGEAVCVAQISGMPVVCDFRTADVALGGQGAPLIPVVDEFLLRREEGAVIALNMGGIANLTYLPPRSSSDPVIAWDTGPANTLIDKAVIEFTRGAAQYDDRGAFARKGRLDPVLLDHLMEHPYLKQPVPKSAGQEQFGFDYYLDLKNIISLNNDNDWLSFIRTLTEFTAKSIHREIISRLNDPGSVAVLYASGGGAENTFIMERLSELFGGTEIKKFDMPGIDSGSKEAFGFAYLGYLFLRQLPGNIPSVTGASREAVLGKLVW
ncbi:MAG: anhydro-N-acetylmuramic acid kinase [Candidatus Marinimicrobia bacterium]|nr:anhydro-N-acetylmuramic acid kinase [Candidatus Neomarinimicrobiota bacterium]